MADRLLAFAALTIASAASIEPTRPFVSIIPNANNLSARITKAVLQKLGALN